VSNIGPNVLLDGVSHLCRRCHGGKRLPGFCKGLADGSGEPGGVVVGVVGQLGHGLLEPFTLGLQSPDLPRYSALRRGVDVRGDEQPRHRADLMIEFAHPAADALQFADALA